MIVSVLAGDYSIFPRLLLCPSFLPSILVGVRLAQAREKSSLFCGVRFCQF
jgi:hypothetical protein